MPLQRPPQKPPGTAPDRFLERRRFPSAIRALPPSPPLKPNGCKRHMQTDSTQAAVFGRGAQVARVKPGIDLRSPPDPLAPVSLGDQYLDDLRLDPAGAAHDGRQVLLPNEILLAIHQRSVRRTRAVEEHSRGVYTLPFWKASLIAPSALAGAVAVPPWRRG